MQLPCRLANFDFSLFCVGIHIYTLLCICPFIPKCCGSDSSEILGRVRLACSACHFSARDLSVGLPSEQHPRSLACTLSNDNINNASDIRFQRLLPASSHWTTSTAVCSSSYKSTICPWPVKGSSPALPPHQPSGFLTAPTPLADGDSMRRAKRRLGYLQKMERDKWRRPTK